MGIERASWVLLSRWLRHRLSRAWLPSVLVAIMAGLAAYFLQSARNQSDADERFAALTQRVTQGIGERLRRYEYGLRGARGVVVAAQGEITREAFSRYAASRQIDQEFPGARGFGIVRLVKREQEAEFVRSMTLEFPNFWLHDIAPHDGDRFVISYVEPAERNQEAIGLDIASESSRRAAALQAAKTSETTLTAPITLVQSSGKQFGGLLLLLPIERTSANGGKALIGWSYAPLLIQDILKGLDAEESHFRLSLYDSAHDPEHAFHATQDGSALDPGIEPQRAEIRLYGRSWRVEMRPTVEFVNSLHQMSPWAEALKAALLGAVFAALLVTAAKLVDRTRGQRLEQARRAAIVEGSDDAIVVQDLDGAITDWNDGASRLFGFSRDEAIGKTATRLLVPGDLAKEDQALRATVAAGGRVQVFETTRRAKDGTHIPVSITASPIYDDHNVVVGSAKILRDVREAKAAEQRMKDLNASLEDQVRDRTALLDVAVHEARDANEAKSRFLANVSHEIRTPMNAVIGLSHALARTRLDADQAAMLSRISTAGKTLLALLNDVLDLSKIEAGEMTIEAAPFSLQEVVDEVCSIASVAAEQRGIEFSRLAVGAPLGPVVGDRTRVAQILLNLLSNAVKFTAQGSVVLELRLGAMNPAGQQPVQFEVRDTGIGIAPEVQERLFQPFVQADASTTRKYGGTGLGLSIVRQLVELLGGSVELESRPGTGSKFTVKLSFAVAPPELHALETPSRPLEPASLAGVRVLVVDDNALNREVAERILREEGASVAQASDGLECVTFVQACAGALDAVLMDVQMPGLDGLEATRHIRGLEVGNRLPIIGLTAGVSAEERRAALDAGMDAVLGKPFDPEALAATVARLLPGRHAQRSLSDVLPSVPADWPRIDGVDAETSFRRLKGDAALLHRMLGSICSSLKRNDELLGHGPPSNESLELHRSSLHDLKAIAGTIGALGISAAAAQAESLLIAGNTGEALGAMTLLSAAGRPLLKGTDASQPSLGEPPADSGERRALGEAERKLAERLLHELESRDLAALASCKALLPGIREAFGAGSAQVLGEQVASLDFEAAERLLVDLLAR